MLVWLRALLDVRPQSPEVPDRVLVASVDKVEVSGNIRYDAGEIIAASGVEQGDNLILLNRYGISRSERTRLLPAWGSAASRPERRR